MATNAICSDGKETNKKRMETKKSSVRRTE